MPPRRPRRRSSIAALVAVLAVLAATGTASWRALRPTRAPRGHATIGRHAPTHPGRPRIAGVRPHAAIARPARTRTDSPALAMVDPPGPIIEHGPRLGRDVALTFDADMTPGMEHALATHRVQRWNDPPLMRELRRMDVPSTVFMTGMWAETYPHLARALARDPRVEVENHSYDHAAWLVSCFGLQSVRSRADKRSEVEHSAQVIRRITGVRVHYFRFPGGCHHGEDDRLVRLAGEQPLGWDVVSGDPFNRDARSIVANVLRGVRPGSIVVLHYMGPPNAPATAAAVRELVPKLRARGFRLVTLRHLLASRQAPPARPAVHT